MIDVAEIKVPIISPKCEPPSIELLKSFAQTNAPVCGVYFLMKNCKVVYIGQSVNVYARIREHKTHKSFTSWCFMACEKKHLDYIESKMIHHFKPKLNYRPIGGNKENSFKETRLIAPISEWDLERKSP